MAEAIFISFSGKGEVIFITVDGRVSPPSSSPCPVLLHYLPVFNYITFNRYLDVENSSELLQRQKINKISLTNFLEDGKVELPDQNEILPIFFQLTLLLCC